MTDSDIEFFEIPGYPPTLRAEKRDGEGGVYWAQVYMYKTDKVAVEFAKRQLTAFIHEQEKEREPTATGEGNG